MKMDLRPIEREISRTKLELNELFRLMALASRRGDSSEAHRKHLALLEKELENIRTIARYVESVSPPVARDLGRWQAQMAERFEKVRTSSDPATLQRWVAQDLVPHLRRSEQVAHLVATSMRIEPKKPGPPFVWPGAVEQAARQVRDKARWGLPS